MIRDCRAASIGYSPFYLKAPFGLIPRNGSITPCLQVLHVLQKVKPDVVQFTAGLPKEVWAPAFCCAVANVPLLAVFQAAPETVQLSSMRLRQLAWARRRRQRWMAVSQENLSNLHATFRTKADEIGILYNGVEISVETEPPGSPEREALRREVRAELGLSSHARLLMTPARLHVKKGHGDLLHIGAALIEEFPDVRFIWAGDGREQEAFEAQVKRQGLEKHVYFLGYRTDVDRLLRASDLLVFPSHAEGGCSSAIREAMVHRLPMVCSDAGGIPEVVHDGIHGLMFPAKDTNAMLAQLRIALRDPSRMRAMAERARKRIEEFSAERMIENYGTVLRELWEAKESLQAGAGGRVRRVA
jgi:glycosyltransferase involved in cell wall biosynthesis